MFQVFQLPQYSPQYRKQFFPVLRPLYSTWQPEKLTALKLLPIFYDSEGVASVGRLVRVLNSLTKELVYPQMLL